MSNTPFVMKFIAFDIGLLAAASAVGIYAATSRLTMLGWLLQYKYVASGKNPLEKRAFVRRQVQCLTWFVFAALVAATGALSAIGIRMIGLQQDEVAGLLEYILGSLWVLIILLFFIFHLWIEGVYQEWWEPPQESPEDVSTTNQSSSQ